MEMTLLNHFEVRSRGFTLVEIIMVMALVGILTVASLTLFEGSLDESRFDATVKELEAIREALIGNQELRSGGQRISFGYNGDVGALPTNGQGLGALTAAPGGVSAWSVNQTVHLSLGWNGPYITTNLSNSDITTDGWGRTYSYNGSTNPATITSLGANGAAGGSGFDSDITISIPNTSLMANVYGFISDGAIPYVGNAVVELYQPNGSGALQTLSDNVVSGDNGSFSFNNVPLGLRSIQIWIPNKASPTFTAGPISITVDQANYLIPTSLTAFAISGGGGGGGGGTGCASASVAYVPASASLSGGGKVLNYNVNILKNVTVSTAVLTFGKSALYSRFDLDGLSYLCSMPKQLSPCPLTTAQTATLTPGMSLTIGSNRVGRIDFDKNMTSTTIDIQLNYSDATCDVMSITGI